MYVTVLAKQDGEVIAGVMSDAEGYFELKIPTAKILSGSYDLVFRYLGRERVERDVAKDIKEIVFIMDNSFVMDNQLITANHSLMDTDIGIGVVTGTGLVKRNIVGRLVEGFHQMQNFYRPMDEWLMMNYSEIQHTGRW